MGKTQEAMPDLWPNKQGASVGVVRSIVKVDGAASRAFGRRRWIARCGYSGRGCQGVLGWFGSYRESLDTVVPYHYEFSSEDAWCLTAPEGFSAYTRRPGREYALIKGKRAKNGDLIGRRSRPRGIEPWVDDPIAEYEAMIEEAEAEGWFSEARALRRELASTRQQEAEWAAESDFVGPASGKSRRITGQFPCPPCIVLCPKCDRPNWVEAPAEPPPVAKLSPERE